MTPQEMCELIQEQAAYSGHSLQAMEHGVIPFATIKQVRKIIILLRECGVPEEWRLWITGQLVDRQLRSSKDLGMAEASAIIGVLTVGPDGRGDEEMACEEAKEAIGMLLLQTMAAGIAKMQKREGGNGTRVEVVQQLGFA